MENNCCSTSWQQARSEQHQQQQEEEGGPKALPNLNLPAEEEAMTVRYSLVSLVVAMLRLASSSSLVL